MEYQNFHPKPLVMAMMLAGGMVGLALPSFAATHCSGTLNSAASSLNCVGGTTGDIFSVTDSSYSFTDPVGAGLGLRVTAGNGDFTLTNVSFDQHTTVVPRVGILSTLAGPGGGNVSLTLGATSAQHVNLTGYGGTAVLASNYGAGNSTVNISGQWDISTRSLTTGDGNDGVEAHAPNGIATIEHTGSGLVFANSGNGFLANGHTGANITVGAGVHIDIDNTASGAAGNVNSGILAKTISGDAVIKSAARMTTTGNSSNGIYGQTTGAGAVDITNTGNISTYGIASHGIQARAENFPSGVVGKITIDNSGDIDTVNTGPATSGSGSHAIHARSLSTNHPSGGIEIRQTGSTLSTTGYDSHGILALSSASSGDIDITTNNTVIDVKGRNSDAIDVQRLSSGNTSFVHTVNINVTTNGGEFKVLDANSAPSGSSNYGIVAYQYDAAAGNINITNNGTKISIGTGADGTSAGSNPITAKFMNNTATGNIVIKNHGELSTQGDNAVAIYANNAGSGTTTIENTANITTAGNASFGIRADGSTSITIYNSGHITTNDQVPLTASYGIGGNINNAGTYTIINDGDIYARGYGTRAVRITGAAGYRANVINNGTIRHDTDGYGQYGIELVGGNNTTLSVENNGIVQGGQFGIVIWNGALDHSGATSTVRIGSTGIVNANNGITVDMSDANTISLAPGAWVNGRRNAALLLRSYGATATPVDTVNNAGLLTSAADQILNTQFANPGASVIFNNLPTGQMTGVMTVSNATTSLDNAGLWNIRKFADTDADDVRDTLSVAVTTLDATASNSVTNRGIIALSGDNGQATTLNNAGEYVTGYVANTMAIGGAVQGQILNVETFTHRGIIDMGSANAAVGDVLLISGGNTPGATGGGVFVSDSGRLLVDTVLNAGGINSQSDMLVVDSTSVASGATAVTVLNAGGAGAMTVDNGIELVRVLDSSQSAAGAFRLGGRVVAGIYEYELYQGGTGVNANDGNWYLRTLTVDGGSNGTGSVPAPRPETGVYLRNLTAASTMFMHTLHDRLGEPQYTDTYQGDGNTPALWVRMVGSQTNSKAANGRIGLDTETMLVHFGGDLARWSDGAGRMHVGLMAAYGQSDIDADPSQLLRTSSGYKRTASGKVEGYSVGAYATWYGNQDKPTGPYVDVWAQYGWYDNKVQGNTLKEEKYDSSGWTVSVEGGYALIANDGDTRQWMIEPQAQLAYNNYSADDHKEANGTWVRNSDADGIIARLGARLYSRSKLDDNGMQPFVETNWWYGNAKNSLTFNGVRLDDDTPDSRVELKAGLQGEIVKGWQVWGHIGGQWGENSYSRYEGMLGVKKTF